MNERQNITQVFVGSQNNNGFGSAGFWISLASFLCCGLLAPLGLLLSIIGLFSPNRGMAVAGTFLGTAGSWWLFAGGFVMLAGIIGALQPPPPTLTRESVDSIQTPIEAEPEEIQLDEPGEAPVDVSPEENLTEPEPSYAPHVTSEAERIDAAKWREWTSGQYKVRAKFVKRIGSQVTLEREDGKQIKIDIGRLSEEDAEFIDKRKWLD
jgi:hypothetical protein